MRLYASRVSTQGGVSIPRPPWKCNGTKHQGTEDAKYSLSLRNDICRLEIRPRQSFLDALHVGRSHGASCRILIYPYRYQYNPIRKYIFKLFAFCPISIDLYGLFIDILIIPTVELSLYGLWTSHLVLAKWEQKPRKHADIYIHLRTCSVFLGESELSPTTRQAKYYTMSKEDDNLPGVWVEEMYVVG